MKDFYKCPICKGTDIHWVKFPDIYCPYCRSYEVVQALSYEEISRRLDDMSDFKRPEPIKAQIKKEKVGGIKL